MSGQNAALPASTMYMRLHSVCTVLHQPEQPCCCVGGQLLQPATFCSWTVETRSSGIWARECLFMGLSGIHKAAAC